MKTRVASLAAAALLLASFVGASGPRFWRIEGSPAFLEGELQQLAVDSLGRLSLGSLPRLLHDPVAPSGWAAARGAGGVVYLATGNSGRLVRFDGRTGTTVLDAEEVGVQAVVVAPDGSVYAATSPDGAVYKLDAAGKASRFFDPEEKYIWALALEASGGLLVATGAGGRVYRVGRDGSSEPLLTSTDTHLLSLAVDAAGQIFAGSAPEGIVYRIDREGRAAVLHDSPFREIRSLDASEPGFVYAAAVESQTVDSAARPGVVPTAPAAPAGATVVPEVTVTESFVVVPPAGGPSAAAPSLAAPAPGAPKGALLRLSASGDAETLWTSTEDLPYVVLRQRAGVVVGTGAKGKLYRVTPDRDWTLFASLPAEQVTALVAGEGDDLYAVTANPARLYQMDGTPATRGSFLSTVKDAEAPALWGAIRFEGRSPRGSSVLLSARAGNTAQPDATWSDWWNPASGEDEPARRGRFLQLRAVLTGDGLASPVIEAFSAAYLQRNLPPEVTTVTVHAAGEVFQKPMAVSGDPEVLGLEPALRGERMDPGSTTAAAPPAVSFSRKMFQRGMRTVSWQGADPNGDSLLYDVQYRAVGEERWRSLRKGLSEPVLAWDTSTVPNGRYVLRIFASDAPDNPPALALTGSRVSPSFEVDNTPPTITGGFAGSSRGLIRASVRDDSPLARLEVSIDGGRWEELHPRDGVADSGQETYDVPVPAASSSLPRTVMLRATDVLGNLATVRFDVP